MIPLRIIHIVAGALWFGAAAFAAFILFPSMRVLGPAAKPLMNEIATVRKWPIIIMATAFLNILSGIALYWIDSAGFTSGFSKSGPGMVFGIGAVFGLLSIGHGVAMNMRTGKRLAALSALEGPAATSAETLQEMQRLQSKMMRAGRVVVVLLFFALVAMSSARYVVW
jgi:uncharacterized membrane protein